MAARRLAPLALLAATLLPAAHTGAQVNLTVTSPAGLSSTNDPYPGVDTWFRDDMRNAGAAGITSTYARSGNASMFLSGTGSPDKANVALYFNPLELTVTRLGNFGGFGYDYYRDATSGVAAHLAPAMRLLVDADGDLNTADRVSLIYEPVYNGVGAVPTNTWNTVSVVGATNLWMFQSGVGVDAVYNRTFADYQSGAYTASAGFAHLDANSLVFGINFGSGSGWSGTFQGAVDNVNFTLTDLSAAPFPISGPLSVNYNFELTPPSTTTPEPASLALVGTGLLGLVGVARKRRK